MLEERETLCYAVISIIRAVQAEEISIMTEKQISKNTGNSKAKAFKIILAVINIALILFAVVFSWIYSRNLREEQKESELESFCATIESMKQISDNYLSMELAYAEDWAKYISTNDMTVNEALAYINEANNQGERYAHIVDMGTLQAYSTYFGDDTKEVGCYRKFQVVGDETYRIFLEIMQQMFEGNSEEICVLGKYRSDDTKLNVISVGTKVSLLSEDGTKKDYLLLRLIPVESIRKIWVFPVQYQSAEVGIITKSGAYVIQSKSMKSRSFADFIRGYNYQDDYNKVDDLIEQLLNTEHGIMRYVDSKGEECYWYYSSFGENSALDILGYIPVSKLNTHKTNWTMVIMTCGVLLLLILLDGAYVLHINRRLREAAQMAEAANRAKTRFLSTMSHDIRTPMNGIIGMTNIARDHINQPEYIKDCLDKVSIASDHLLTLINDILDISKVESGNMVLNPAVFSIEKSVDRLVDIIRPQINEKKIDFSIEKELPVSYLIADELRTNQIFINILTNAVKYTPQGGSIKMTVKEEILPGRKVKLIYQVSDTGVGMSDDFQENMYDMFARERDSRIDKIQGTGLGLAIVRQMVDLMHGTITCDSTVGEGTVFTVMLELKEASEQEYRELEHENENDESNHFEGIRVLVTEDNELNWEIIDEQLKALCVQCDHAENGEECITLVNDSPDGYYDLILMDIQMPVMNGKEAARRIRQSDRAYVRDMMIVAMTADAFAEDVQDCINAGMNGHIAKPVDMKKVQNVLRKIKYKKNESQE